MRNGKTKGKNISDVAWLHLAMCGCFLAYVRTRHDDERYTPCRRKITGLTGAFTYVQLSNCPPATHMSRLIVPCATADGKKREASAGALGKMAGPQNLDHRDRLVRSDRSIRSPLRRIGIRGFRCAGLLCNRCVERGAFWMVKMEASAAGWSDGTAIFVRAAVTMSSLSFFG